MKILFISSNLIGDSILSTGILSNIIDNNTNSKVTIVTGPTAYELFLEFPQVERIIVLKKLRFSLHWINLWIKLINHKWDLIVDLRSSLISYFLFHKEKKIFINNNKPIYQVEKLSIFYKSKNILMPKIWVSKNDNEQAKLILKNNTTIAISPGGNWEPKIWSIENYIDLIMNLTKTYNNKNLKFLIVGSNQEEKKYYEKINNNIQNDILINLMGKDLRLTYACLSKCKLFIGNDSGLMHLSAATGINTIGLFGPTRDDWYGPFGNKCYVIRTKESYEILKNKLNDKKKSLMNSISVNDVKDFIYNKKLI